MFFLFFFLYFFFVESMNKYFYINLENVELSPAVFPRGDSDCLPSGDLLAYLPLIELKINK